MSNRKIFYQYILFFIRPPSTFIIQRVCSPEFSSKIVRLSWLIRRISARVLNINSFINFGRFGLRGEVKRVAGKVTRLDYFTVLHVGRLKNYVFSIQIQFLFQYDIEERINQAIAALSTETLKKCERI